MNELEVNSPQLESTLMCVKREIIKRGKPILVVSDIDDTLANTYNFDSLLLSHIPHITDEIVMNAKKLQLPLLLATGRPNTDPAVSNVWRLLSKPNYPIVVENGGAIFNPETGNVQLLATSKQIELINETKQIVSNSLARVLTASHEDEISIDTSRLTSIEIRIQNKQTKIGSPLTHAVAARILQNIFDPTRLVAISSGSSVSIHSPEISKGAAILTELSQLGIQRKEITLLALGDNINDSSLFSISDVSVGVGKDTIGLAQFVCPFGEITSAAILRLVKDFNI